MTQPIDTQPIDTQPIDTQPVDIDTIVLFEGLDGATADVCTIDGSCGPFGTDLADDTDPTEDQGS